jgi:hypothetical protein
MVEYVLDGAPAEAYGHPSVCSEPAPGTVTDTSPVTYNGTPIATQQDGTIDFDSHGHSTTDTGSCTDYQTHSVTPQTVSPSVTYNGYGSVSSLTMSRQILAVVAV